MKSNLDIMFYFATSAMYFLWAGMIFGTIIKSHNPHEVLEELVAGTLCLMIWLLIRKGDKLRNEALKYKAENKELLSAISAFTKANINSKFKQTLENTKEEVPDQK